jgi:hypothetical protein
MEKWAHKCVVLCPWHFIALRHHKMEEPVQMQICHYFSRINSRFAVFVNKFWVGVLEWSISTQYVILIQLKGMWGEGEGYDI